MRKRWCPQGTTTICWDPHELGNVLGLAGVRWAIEAARGLPLRVLVLAPVLRALRARAGTRRRRVRRGRDGQMLAWPEVAGVAEVMDMRGVLDARHRCRYRRRWAGKQANWSAATRVAWPAPDLQGFAAAGIESDHEITSGEDLLAKFPRRLQRRAARLARLRAAGRGAGAARAAGDAANAYTLHRRRVSRRSGRRGGMIDVLRRLVPTGCRRCRRCGPRP